jgi:hypothetical protein
MIEMLIPLLMQQQQKAAQKVSLSNITSDMAPIGGILQAMSLSKDGNANPTMGAIGGAVSGASAGASAGPFGALLGAILGGTSGYGSANKANADYFDYKTLQDQMMLSEKTISPDAGLFGKGGLMGTDQITPVQMDEDEYYVTPDMSIYKSKSESKHEKMEAKEITDLVQPQSYAFSERLKFKPKTFKDTIVGYGLAHYSENNEYELEEIELGDVLGDSKKAISFSEGAKMIKDKFKTVREDDKDIDVLTKITNQENKIARAPYINKLIQIQEKQPVAKEETFTPLRFASGGPIPGMDMNQLLQLLSRINGNNINLGVDNGSYGGSYINPLPNSNTKVGYKYGNPNTNFFAMPGVNRTGTNWNTLDMITNGERTMAPLDANSILNNMPNVAPTYNQNGYTSPSDVGGLAMQDLIGGQQSMPGRPMPSAVPGVSMSQLLAQRLTPVATPAALDSKSVLKNMPKIPAARNYNDYTMNSTTQAEANAANANTPASGDLFSQFGDKLKELDKTNEELYKKGGTDINSLYKKLGTRAGASAILNGLAIGLQDTQVNPNLTSTRFVDGMFEELSPAAADAASAAGFSRAGGLISAMSPNNQEAALNVAPQLFDAALRQSNTSQLNTMLDNLATRRAKYSFLNSAQTRNTAERNRAEQITSDLLNQKRSGTASNITQYLSNMSDIDTSKLGFNRLNDSQYQQNRLALFEKGMALASGKAKYDLAKESSDKQIDAMIGNNKTNTQQSPSTFNVPITGGYTPPVDNNGPTLSEVGALAMQDLLGGQQIMPTATSSTPLLVKKRIGGNGSYKLERDNWPDLSVDTPTNITPSFSTTASPIQGMTMEQLLKILGSASTLRPGMNKNYKLEGDNWLQ